MNPRTTLCQSDGVQSVAADTPNTVAARVAADKTKVLWMAFGMLEAEEGVVHLEEHAVRRLTVRLDSFSERQAVASSSPRHRGIGISVRAEVKVAGFRTQNNKKAVATPQPLSKSQHRYWV